MFIIVYIPFKNLTGVEIHPMATIEGGLFIPHCNGIVISKSAKIGENFTIHQFSTVGVNYKNKMAPTIGDNVFVSCNSSLIGHINVGNQVYILPNSSVVKNVPHNVVVGGVPSKIVKVREEMENI